MKNRAKQRRKKEMMENLTAFLFPIICGLFVYLMIALWIVFGY